VDDELTRQPGFRASFVAAYAAMLLGGVALFLVVRNYGEMLTAPAPPLPTAAIGAAVSPAPNALLHVLLALVAVIVLGRVLGAALQSVGQPPVVGEVLAGIVLGPSLLGRIAPHASAYMLPPSVAPFLNVVAQLGIILYMFLVGLELNADLVRRRAHATVATSHASIVAPFVLGSALALFLYPRLSTSDVSFTSFALFMGIAMSITAFPVLARILTDRGISKSELGAVALTCAAADDVTAWCLLALVVGVTQARIEDAIGVSVLTLGYIAIMFLAVRPMVVRIISRFDDRRPTAQVLALVGVLLSALATEWIGVHAVFGAFLFGAVIPHNSAVARTLTDHLEDVVTILLLPAFFAFTGMRTEIGLISGSQWLLCGLIILVATIGKFGGSFVAARLTGLDWRSAAGLGVLMNTRGLMELIVLNIGLDLRVISPVLFTMMVLMALVTTVATTPALQLLGIDRARMFLRYNPAAVSRSASKW
jgi:Kef-type K+ transport system membrane component KefB